MKRVYDLDLINSYLMMPDILPHFFVAEEKHIRNINLFFMLGDYGLFPCLKTGAVMDCHAAIPHKNRGKKALADGRNLIKWVFEHTLCTKISTRARKEHKQRLFFNSLLLEREKEDETYVYYQKVKQ